MKLKAKILTIFLLSVIIFCPKTAEAEEKNSGPVISVVPHTFDLAVFPGEIVNDKIKIYNQGDVAVPFKLKLISFDAEDKTGDMVMSNLGNENIFLKEWIRFDKEEFIIDPKKKETVNFSLKIPADTKNQGYYFTVLLEADISTYYFNENQIQAIPNLAILFLLKVGEEEEGGEKLTVLEYSIPEEKRLLKAEKIVNFFANPFLNEDEKIAVMKSGEPEFKVKLKNNSFYHTKLTGKIDLSGVGWKVKDELEFPPLTILPGKTRELLIGSQAGENKMSTIGVPSAIAAEKNGEKQTNVGFGLMCAKLNLESNEGIKKEENQLVFVFSWQMAGWLILLIAFIFGCAKMIKKWFKIRKNACG